jgi:predicted HTH domain antitoxin
MNVITLQIPDSVDINEFDLKMNLASKLFDEGKLSSGQAAEMAGVSKRTFIELLGNYGVSLFGNDFEELENTLY